MPRKSQKAKVIEEIYYDSATRLLELDSSDDSEVEDEIHEEFEGILEQVT